MQEDINHRTVALVITTTKLTASAVRAAMREYLIHRNKVKANKEPKHGKMSVRKLLGKDQGAQTLEVNNKSIKGFERIAGKYNIDFAVKKDVTSDAGKYIVFFKGRDQDVIARAFQEYVVMNEKKQDKPSLKARLSAFVEEVNKVKAKSLHRVKQRQKKLEKSL